MALWTNQTCPSLFKASTAEALLHSGQQTIRGNFQSPLHPRSISKRIAQDLPSTLKHGTINLTKTHDCCWYMLVRRAEWNFLGSCLLASLSCGLWMADDGSLLSGAKVIPSSRKVLEQDKIEHCSKSKWRARCAQTC